MNIYPRRASHHEAGHVLAAVHYRLGITRASLDPPGVATDGSLFQLSQRAYDEGLLVLCYAGYEAELFFDNRNAKLANSDGDMRVAAKVMLRNPDLSATTAAKAAKDLVRGHWAEIQTVACELIIHRELTLKDIMRILRKRW